uniref:Uncharacterized protein n=1 Tax=Anopheles melas TaxID=34690 RepID=A0A182UF90_9DIPT
MAINISGDIPLHVAMLSHLLIAWDRKRWLTDPLKVRLPAFVCSCASWLAGLVIALPYPIYTTYLDLELELDFLPSSPTQSECERSVALLITLINYQLLSRECVATLPQGACR